MPTIPDSAETPEVPEAPASSVEQTSEAAAAKPASTTRPQPDPEAIERARFEVLARQRFVIALIAGLVASVIGAVIWAGIAYATEYEIGWIAIGIGFLVGITVQISGRAVTPAFGILGAGLSLFSVVLGKYLAIIAIIAAEAEMSYAETIGVIGPSEIVEILQQTFSPIDLLFYGIALWQGYKLAFKDTDQAIAEQLQSEPS